MIRFIPQYFERLWGGQALASKFGRALPVGRAKIGESWDICDRPEGMSIVAEGIYEGLSLHDLWLSHRQELFGEDFDDISSFPLMVKTISPDAVLSIQVHPHPVSMEEFQGEEKNEFWYIADASPVVPVYAGFKGDFDLSLLEETMKAGAISAKMQQFDMGVGESLMIPSGLVHALGAPCIVYEIQQNSDTTYRMDDWRRLDVDGKPREVHFKESLLCAQQGMIAPKPRVAGLGLLVENAYFRVDEVLLHQGDYLEVSDFSRFALLTVVEGSLMGATKGDTVLLPAASPVLRIDEDSVRLLITQIPRDTFSLC